MEITYTQTLEVFIAHEGPKIAYGKQALGNALFIQANELLFQQGIDTQEINLTQWDELPMFFGTSETATIPFDLLAATFYLLSRYEEYLPHVSDDFGRFPAEASLAYKASFLDKPLINLWAFKFGTILKTTFPDLTLSNKKSTTSIAIDLGVPYAFLKRGILRTTIGYIQDVTGLKFFKIWQRTLVLLRIKKDPYDFYNTLISIQKTHGVLNFLIRLGDPLQFQDSYNTRRKSVEVLFKKLADYAPLGLLVSFKSLTKSAKLKSEVNRLQHTLHKPISIGIAEIHKIVLPKVYRNFLEAEICKDFSMVYPQNPGFRASTCTPFYWYDIDNETKTPLQIMPVFCTSNGLITTPIKTIKDTLQNAYVLVNKLGGTWSCVISNKSIASSKGALWLQYLKLNTWLDEPN